MKTLLNILTLLILTANFANGQTMDKTLQKLINIKLIEQKQANDFEELLKKSETKSNAVYLTILFQSEYKKLTGHYSQFGSYISLGEEKPKPAEQTKINEELIQYLSKLKSCDLISENQFTHFQSKVNNNEFVHSLQLLPSIIEQVALKEHMNPEKLKVFADKLKSKEIVNSKYDSLIVDIQQEKLQNPIEFLNYCNKAVIINEQDYPTAPEKYLELIHQKTASIIPELAFTDFQFQIVLDSSISDNDSKFYDFVVSLKSNGKKYKQKSNYHLYSPSKNQYYGNKIDQQEYYKIFNKILADLQSPYRLHEVKTHQGNAVEWKVFGIIALTKEQADLLHSGGVYFTPSYESFKNKLTSKKIEQTIEEYKKIGLLSHLTNEQIEKAKEKVSEQENSNLNEVLMAFPDVIYMFDTELGNLEDPYAELIREYKKISHNDFNATEISDNFDIEKKKKVELKFKIGSKSYNKTLKIEDDWIDTEFFNFIKSVVSEQNLTGQFYELYTGGQEASIIYLTLEQYNYLRTNKLLVFGDEWQTEE
ncbi:MAG: hypothetical protein R3D00_27285 [Bacteroidia bacterium]